MGIQKTGDRRKSFFDRIYRIFQEYEVSRTKQWLR